MASYRIEKINVQIQRELSLIIRKRIKDRRIPRDTLSITGVKSSPDLNGATVYVSFYVKAVDKEKAIEALDNASGFLRTALGKVMKTHKTPALHFELDDSVDYAMHIEALLQDINIRGKDDKAD